MSAPTISVVIPTYGRPAMLADCLSALAQQDLPREQWEVVVVDDGSPDPGPVADVAASYRDRLGVVLVRQANAGPATARNTGAARAALDYLAFTDDDCRPRADWLSALAASFTAAPNAVLGGSAVSGIETNLCSEASHLLVEYVVDYFLERGAAFFPSNNLALARAAFDAVGGFDVEFSRAAGEDRDFCAKCLAAGLPLLRAADAVVEHRHPMSLRGFLRQHFNYGRGAYLHHKLEARRSDHRLRVEPLRFYLDLVRAPFRAGRPTRGKLRLAALLFLSQAANAAGFFAEKVRPRNRRAPLPTTAEGPESAGEPGLLVGKDTPDSRPPHAGANNHEPW